MPQIDFRTLYERRLAKMSKGTPHISGPTRVATVPYKRDMWSRAGVGMLETVVPAGCLVVPSFVDSCYLMLLIANIVEFCDQSGIKFNRTFCPFMGRYTSPGGSRRWADDWRLHVLRFDDVGDQVILKLMFSNLC
jgi:hypothetical protein